MKFDDYMRDSLREAAQDVTPDPALYTRVKAHAAAKKPHRARRIVLAAAVMACLAVTTAVARGPVAYLLSGIPVHGSQIVETADKDTLTGKLGYDVALPETLNGNFPLDNAEALPTHMMDGDNNELGAYLELYARYESADARAVLSAEQADLADDSSLSDTTIVETCEIGGCTVTYREIPMVMYPADADIPEEELAAQARGEMFVSEGSDVREEFVTKTARWEMDGLSYSIQMFDYNGDWTAEDFFAAAQDVMNAG